MKKRYSFMKIFTVSFSKYNIFCSYAAFSIFSKFALFVNTTITVSG